MLAVPKRIYEDRDLIAGKQTSGLPPLAHQFNRGTHLNAPLEGFRAGIARIGYENLDPAVRIRPLELLHRADERDLLCLIEHRARVVRECRGGGERRQNGGKRYSENVLHRSVGSSVSEAGRLYRAQPARYNARESQAPSSAAENRPFCRFSLRRPGPICTMLAIGFWQRGALQPMKILLVVLA